MVLQLNTITLLSPASSPPLSLYIVDSVANPDPDSKTSKGIQNHLFVKLFFRIRADTLVDRGQTNIAKTLSIILCSKHMCLPGLEFVWVNMLKNFIAPASKVRSRRWFLSCSSNGRPDALSGRGQTKQAKNIPLFISWNYVITQIRLLLTENSFSALI